MTVLLSIPIASYYSIKRLALKYFFSVQQDHKLIGIGITSFTENLMIEGIYCGTEF